MEGEVASALLDGRGPRSVGELLDEAVEVLRHDFLRLTAMAMIVWLPVRAVVSAIGYYGPQSMDIVGGENGEEFFIFLAAQWMVGLWSGVTQTVALAAVAIIVFARLGGERVGLWQAFKTALRKLPALIVIGLATAMAAGMGMLLCIAPGIWLMWKLQLASYLPVLEGATIGNSFSRSWSLTTDSFWRWLGLIATTMIVLFPVQLVVGLPYDLTVRPIMFDNTGWDPLTFELVMVPVTTLIIGLTSALMGAVHTVYYVDQRVRREGLDLEVQLEGFERKRAAKVLRSGAKGSEFGGALGLEG